MPDTSPDKPVEILYFQHGSSPDIVELKHCHFLYVLMQQSSGWGAILQIYLSYTTQHRLFFSTQFSLTGSSDHAAYQRFIKKLPHWRFNNLTSWDQFCWDLTSKLSVSSPSSGSMKLIFEKVLALLIARLMKWTDPCLPLLCVACLLPRSALLLCGCLSSSVKCGL